ncbi:pip [Scenedesmus sp. PABB004]|nr:pip [Scenedesmus sp. PABB004]
MARQQQRPPAAALPVPPCARPARQTQRRGLHLQSRSVWDDSLTLADLRSQLDAAVSSEDYALAAKIRDTLQQRQTDARLAIEDANQRFYTAFASGSMKEMQTVWGSGEHVQCIHPGAACIAGRDLVMESWDAILRGVRPGAFKIDLEDVRVFALSETQGLVTCVEVMDADDTSGRTIATNLYELQDGNGAARTATCCWNARPGAVPAAFRQRSARVRAAAGAAGEQPPPPLRGLYPPSAPHASGHLRVSELHSVYYEVHGNPRGTPAIVVHGGPGAGCFANHARFFDPDAYRIILLDQRGCGRSTPAAALAGNTTSELVADLEALRRHLGVRRWLLFGGSWGVALSLAYAQAHPGVVLGLVLRGVCLMRPQEIAWMYGGGAAALRPLAWAAFTAGLPPREAANPLLAHYSRLLSADAATRQAATKAWMTYEYSVGFTSSQQQLMVWDGEAWGAEPAPGAPAAGQQAPQPAVEEELRRHPPPALPPPPKPLTPAAAAAAAAAAAGDLPPLPRGACVPAEVLAGGGSSGGSSSSSGGGGASTVLSHNCTPATAAAGAGPSGPAGAAGSSGCGGHGADDGGSADGRPAWVWGLPAQGANLGDPEVAALVWAGLAYGGHDGGAAQALLEAHFSVHGGFLLEAPLLEHPRGSSALTLSARPAARDARVRQRARRTMRSGARLARILAIGLTVSVVMAPRGSASSAPCGPAACGCGADPDGAAARAAQDAPAGGCGAAGSCAGGVGRARPPARGELGGGLAAGWEWSAGCSACARQLDAAPDATPGEHARAARVLAGLAAALAIVAQPIAAVRSSARRPAGRRVRRAPGTWAASPAVLRNAALGLAAAAAGLAWPRWDWLAVLLAITVQSLGVRLRPWAAAAARAACAAGRAAAAATGAAARLVRRRAAPLARAVSGGEEADEGEPQLEAATAAVVGVPAQTSLAGRRKQTKGRLRRRAPAGPGTPVASCDELPAPPAARPPLPARQTEPTPKAEPLLPARLETPEPAPKAEPLLPARLETPEPAPAAVRDARRRGGCRDQGSPPCAAKIKQPGSGGGPVCARGAQLAAAVAAPTTPTAPGRSERARAATPNGGARSSGGTGDSPNARGGGMACSSAPPVNDTAPPMPTTPSVRPRNPFAARGEAPHAVARALAGPPPGYVAAAAAVAAACGADRPAHGRDGAAACRPPPAARQARPEPGGPAGPQRARECVSAEPWLAGEPDDAGPGARVFRLFSESAPPLQAALAAAAAAAAAGLGRQPGCAGPVAGPHHLPLQWARAVQAQVACCAAAAPPPPAALCGWGSADAAALSLLLPSDLLAD